MDDAMYERSRSLPRSFLFTSTLRSWLALLCLAAGVSACTMGARRSDETEYHISSSRPSSQVTVSNEESRADVEVYSDNGIGNATIRLVSGEWPPSLLLRFHLQGLEGLQFLYGETLIDVSVNTEAQILQSVTQGSSGPETVDDGSRFWMPVSFLDKDGTAVDAPVAGGVIEVLSPASFHAGEYPEFTINWIDFYR